jgi:hypothetical protein
MIKSALQMQTRHLSTTFGRDTQGIPNASHICLETIACLIASIACTPNTRSGHVLRAGVFVRSESLWRECCYPRMSCPLHVSITRRDEHLAYSKVLPLMLRQGKTSRYQVAGTVGRLKFFGVLEPTNSSAKAMHDHMPFTAENAMLGSKDLASACWLT